MIPALRSISYTFVLLYGALLSIDFAGGYPKEKKRSIAAIVIGVILFLQILCTLLFGIGFTTKIYPFISHLPLVLLLMIYLKKPMGVAVVSVFTAYFCCQIPRWIGNVALYIFQTQIAALIVYTIAIVVCFFLLRRFLAQPAYRAMTYSKQSLVIFGCLPVFYYLFDYGTTVYTDALYRGIKMINEFLPAAMALFYVLFITLYHDEVQKRNKIEMDNAVLALRLEQSARQIQEAKASQELSKIYRHDLRHHFSLLRGFAENEDIEKIKGYLLEVQNNIESITPVCYCENETVNLILSSFAHKAQETGVSLLSDVVLPEGVAIDDTELCAVLFNGLENAFAAASKVTDKALRTVQVRCTLNRDKLLVMMKNTYVGNILLENGLPVSQQEGHGFGCRSIAAIAEKRNGFCTFQAEDSIFTLRVVLPLGQ